jgi:hypothetical protein
LGTSNTSFFGGDLIGVVEGAVVVGGERGLREANALASALEDVPYPVLVFALGLKPGVNCGGPVVLVDADFGVPSLVNLVACGGADGSLRDPEEGREELLPPKLNDFCTGSSRLLLFASGSS